MALDDYIKKSGSWIPSVGEEECVHLEETSGGCVCVEASFCEVEIVEGLRRDSVPDHKVKVKVISKDTDTIPAQAKAKIVDYEPCKQDTESASESIENIRSVIDPDRERKIGFYDDNLPDRL